MRLLLQVNKPAYKKKSYQIRKSIKHQQNQIQNQMGGLIKHQQNQHEHNVKGWSNFIYQILNTILHKRIHKFQGL
jgi:hypothetical protein